MYQDQTFIERLKKGDQTAFGELIHRYQSIVVNTCYSFVLNKEDAEDLAQEVFMEVFRSVGSFKGDALLSTWLYRISVNKSIDLLRNKKRKKRIQKVIGFFDKENRQVIDIASDQPDPASQLLQEEQVQLLHKAVGQLPGNQQIAFSLNKFEQLPAPQVAIIMDLSVGSVESLLHRAKQNIREILKHYHA
jgi:RNA polymerase sigma-70 factor (ECF subfamily)